MSALPVLYSFRRCPYAMRARLALAISGQVCELREVVLRNKPQGLLQASPKATVPVLLLTDGRVLDQSLDIMLWALARNDPGAWLAPSPVDRDEQLSLIAECDGRFKQALDRCKYLNRYPEVDAAAERAVAMAWLQTLEERLAHDPHLLGTHATLADMAIAPFVRQFASIDPLWWSAQSLPHLQAWLAQWQASDLLASVMHKVPVWMDGTEGVLFPFADPSPPGA